MDEHHSKEEARKLYLRLAKRYHPDLFKAGNAAQNNDLMRQINEAWDARNLQKLRDIDQYGVDYLALKKQSPPQWQSEARDWVKTQTDELRREAIKRDVMTSAAKSKHAFVQSETPKWGPRPEFSYIYGDRGRFSKMFHFLKFWNPCSNWIANGSYLIFLRMLMQLAIIAAWILAGVLLFRIFKNFAAEDFFGLMCKTLGEIFGVGVAFAAGIVLVIFARKSLLLLLCCFLAAWGISEWLPVPSAIPIAAYGIAAAIWMVRTCIEDA